MEHPESKLQKDSYTGVIDARVSWWETVGTWLCQ